MRAHLADRDDEAVTVAPVLDRYGDFRKYLGEAFDEDAAYAALRKAEMIGRPMTGSRRWKRRAG